MKVGVIEDPEVQKEVPPLTLLMTFETEAEMQAYRGLVGPIVDPLNVLFTVHQLIGDHLEKYTGKRDNRK